MAKAKLKRGQKLLCVPCGREVTISASGVARTTLWCCGRPMGGRKKKAASKKVVKKKPAKKKVVKKKAAKKKVVRKKTKKK